RLAAALRRFEPEQLRDQPGSRLQRHPAFAELIRCGRQERRQYEWEHDSTIPSCWPWLVKNGTVRYFLLHGSGGGGPGGGQSTLTTWITQHCTAVSSSQWQSTSTSSSSGGFGGDGQLYTCTSAA